MWELETKVNLTKKAINSPNLAEKMGERDRDMIAGRVWDGYERDKQSREKWEEKMAGAMELAMQLKKAKNFPWPGAANIAFPLVTISSLQFHARAYPALISGSRIVNCKVFGEDPQLQLSQIADRIGKHMSWQLLEEDEDWEEEHDKLLIVLPIMGCAFKKSYFSPLAGHNISELVLPQDLVVDYNAKSIDGARRKTHRIPMYRNDIYEKVMQGVYLDVREEGWFNNHPIIPAPSRVEAVKQTREGVMPVEGDSSTPFTILEQHTWMDLDGDGYEEPYIISIEEGSKKLLRIVARFGERQISRSDSGDIFSIQAEEYFTKYSFIPSPDGGIYDIGFGTLLCPINESVNSIINQLVDAGTMANTGGGFLGRGVTVRGGNYSFAPNEWKRVDSPGDDLKKNIMPLPVREPSTVLFQLLGFLVEYANRISASTELMSGENIGQNTKAATTQIMAENGMKIYNAIYKRVWRSMKKEFKKLFILNSINLTKEQSFGTGMMVQRQDYLISPNNVVPAADPYISSDQQRIQQATMLRQAAYTAPGYNVEAVERFWLHSLQIDGDAIFYPGPSKTPPAKDPKMAIEEMKLKGKQMEIQARLQETLIKLQAQQMMDKAKIDLLEAQASKVISDIGGDKAARQIEGLKMAIDAIKTQHEVRQGYLDLMQTETQNAHTRGMERLEAESGDEGSDEVS